MSLLIRIIAAAIIYGGALLTAWFLWKIFDNRKRLVNVGQKQYSLLEILVPKNNERGPLAAESLYATLHGIYDINAKVQDHIAFELISKDQTIKFFIYAPSHLKDFIEGQIYAQYPTVEISEVPDYTNNIPEHYVVAGANIVLNKNEVFPIKTFESFEVDPLSGITGVLSKIAIGEQIWMQFIIRPVSDSWQKKGINYIKAIRSGQIPEEKLSSSLVKGLGSFATDVLKSAASGPTSSESGSGDKAAEVKLSGPEEAALSGVETKVEKLGFETKIRVLSIGQDEATAKSKVISVTSAFKQFNTPNLNGFSNTNVIVDPELIDIYKTRSMDSGGYILNIGELASIYHLPSVTVLTPSISWAGSKKGEPPVNLPIEGATSAEELTLFGQTNFRHLTHKFGIKTKDRRLHFYGIGKTGTGKSTLLENMIIDDIRAGRGVAVVDPHGDLVDHVLEFIPEERIKDVVYFAPADRQFPVGFNILESVGPDLKAIVASGVVGIFKKIFGDSWGPRLEYILRNTVFALLDFPDATMLGITTMLVDKTFRSKVVENITDPVIKHFWVNEFEKYDQKFRTEAVAPIQNKVGQFLSSSTIRNIVGQPKSTINLKEIMDTKKILLLDLSIGKIGEDTAALLGAMMITKIQLAAMARASIVEEERVDFYLYVDEFQNFATDSFATILSEARKYKLNLIMTNQYIAQMPEIVQKAVFGNVGTIVSFRVGATDAGALVKEFEPVFDANDLINLSNYNIYVKMAIDGVTSPAFSALTLPPYKEIAGNRDKIIEMSRQTYSKSRAEVEDHISNSAQYSSTSGGASKNNESDATEKVRYPRDVDGGYIELKDPKSNQLFYMPGSLSDEIKPDLAEEVKANNQEVKPESISSVAPDQVANPTNVSPISKPSHNSTSIQPKSSGGFLQRRIDEAMALQRKIEDQANQDLPVKEDNTSVSTQVAEYNDGQGEIQPLPEDSTTIDL